MIKPEESKVIREFPLDEEMKNIMKPIFPEYEQKIN